MSFGSRLKARREQLGITQIQLAQKLGITKGAVGNYEAEISSPKPIFCIGSLMCFNAMPIIYFKMR